MKCPVCGFENENDSQFCGNCGTPLIPEEPEKKGSKKTPVIIAVVYDSDGGDRRRDHRAGYERGVG